MQLETADDDLLQSYEGRMRKLKVKKLIQTHEPSFDKFWSKAGHHVSSKRSVEPPALPLKHLVKHLFYVRYESDGTHPESQQHSQQAGKKIRSS